MHSEVIFRSLSVSPLQVVQLKVGAGQPVPNLVPLENVSEDTDVQPM